MRSRENRRQLLISNAVSLGAGALSALLTGGAMKKYHMMKQPPLSPPGWIFPVVWTGLYVLMGTASWLVSRSSSSDRGTALRFYAAQLAANMLWPFLFFKFEAYWLAFFWLLLLWYLVFETTRLFRAADTTAGKLMLPYLAWCTFALYLNLGAAVLN